MSRDLKCISWNSTWDALQREGLSLQNQLGNSRYCKYLCEINLNLNLNLRMLVKNCRIWGGQSHKLLVACLTCNALFCNLLKNYCFASKWKPLRRAMLLDARLRVDAACLPRHMDINIYLCWSNSCYICGKCLEKTCLCLKLVRVQLINAFLCVT